jgi:hypothetical protein
VANFIIFWHNTIIGIISVKFPQIDTGIGIIYTAIIITSAKILRSYVERGINYKKLCNIDTSDIIYTTIGIISVKILQIDTYISVIYAAIIVNSAKS